MHKEGTPEVALFRDNGKRSEHRLGVGPTNRVRRNRTKSTSIKVGYISFQKPPSELLCFENMSKIGM